MRIIMYKYRYQRLTITGPIGAYHTECYNDGMYFKTNSEVVRDKWPQKHWKLSGKGPTSCTQFW